MAGSRSDGNDDDIAARLARAGSEAASQHDFRQRALALVRAAVAHDAALFHALSPRVPLSTAASHGLDATVLARSAAGWDDLAVALGALRAAANERLVVSAAEVYPRGSRAAAELERLLWRGFAMRSLCVMHLIVRDTVHAAVVLLGRRADAFTRRQVARLRALAPLLAVADALHGHLDGAPAATTPRRLRCRDQRLTERQRGLVELVALGHTNDEIALALGLSRNTVRNQLARVFGRLGAANRADVVRLAVLTPQLA